MLTQEGRCFVVTGATGGLGLELTRALATAGAEVVMAVRDLARGGQAADRVRRTGARGRVVVRRLDVADLASVRAFAAGIDRVDVLINNAGIMGVPFERTVDGFESQIGVNHLGAFALANLLLPKLGDRVVAVSSAAHWTGRLDVDDLDLERRGYSPYGAYAQSKLANLLFVAELQRRLDRVGSPLRAVAGHPGYASTGIQLQTGSRAFTGLGNVGNALVGMPPSRGALPILRAATDDLPGNSFVGPSRLLFGRPVAARRSRQARDPALARALWQRSEQLTGVSCPL